MNGFGIAPCSIFWIFSEDKKGPVTMSQELVALLSTDSLSINLLDDVEKRLAATAAAEMMPPAKVRSALWTPISQFLLGRIGKGDVATDAFLVHFLEETLSNAESYNRSNIGMELIRTAVIEKHPSFDWPSYHAAAMVYDPFIKGATLPSFESLKRVFLDTNIELKDVEQLFSTEPTEEQKSTIDGFAIPQAIPGLGYLTVQRGYSICGLSTLSDTIETLNGNKHGIELPSGKENAEVRYQWLTNVADKLRIRLMIVNMMHNLITPHPVIKYKPECVEVDMKSRKHVITKELIDALSPFEFPPVDGTLVNTDPKAYRLFGLAGPLYVVLDYGYGEKRYLLLSHSRTQVELSPDSMPGSLKFMGPTGLDDNLRTVLGMQHFSFMAKYIPFYTSGLKSSETSTPQIIPSRGAVQFEDPIPGVDLFKYGMTIATEYMKQFLEAVDLSRPPLSELPKADKRLRISYQTMYSDKIRDAIERDIAEGRALFSLESESSKIISLFEAHFLGLER